MKSFVQQTLAEHQDLIDATTSRALRVYHMHRLDDYEDAVRIIVKVNAVKGVKPTYPITRQEICSLSIRVHKSSGTHTSIIMTTTDEEVSLHLKLLESIARGFRTEMLILRSTQLEGEPA